jgi:hypothetical protein
MNKDDGLTLLIALIISIMFIWGAINIFKILSEYPECAFSRDIVICKQIIESRK